MHVMLCNVPSTIKMQLIELELDTVYLILLHAQQHLWERLMVYVTVAPPYAAFFLHHLYP